MRRRYYTLRDRTILQWLMQHPGRGTRYTIRELANASNCSHSLIGHLLSGNRTTCDASTAHNMSEALGVAVLVLFAPPASPDPNEPISEPTRPAKEQ